MTGMGMGMGTKIVGMGTHSAWTGRGHSWWGRGGDGANPVGTNSCPHAALYSAAAKLLVKHEIHSGIICTL